MEGRKGHGAVGQREHSSALLRTREVTVLDDWAKAVTHAINRPFFGDQCPGAGEEAFDVKADLTHDLSLVAEPVESGRPIGGPGPDDGFERQPVSRDERIGEAVVKIEARGGPSDRRGNPGGRLCVQVGQGGETPLPEAVLTQGRLSQVEADLGELLGDFLIVVDFGDEVRREQAAVPRLGDFEVQLRSPRAVGEVRAEVANKIRVARGVELAGHLDAVGGATVNLAVFEGPRPPGEAAKAIHQ